MPLDPQEGHREELVPCTTVPGGRFPSAGGKVPRPARLTCAAAGCGW